MSSLNPIGHVCVQRKIDVEISDTLHTACNVPQAVRWLEILKKQKQINSINTVCSLLFFCIVKQNDVVKGESAIVTPQVVCGN